MNSDPEYDAAEAERLHEVHCALHHAIDELGPRECLRVIADMVERKTASKMLGIQEDDPF